VQFNNLTQRVNTVIMRIQGHKPSMAAIADMNGVIAVAQSAIACQMPIRASCWQVPCASAMARASKPG
jgi:hypothetical protein